MAFGTASLLGSRTLVAEENIGQTDPRVKFTARGPGRSTLLFPPAEAMGWRPDWEVL